MNSLIRRLFSRYILAFALILNVLPVPCSHGMQNTRDLQDQVSNFINDNVRPSSRTIKKIAGAVLGLVTIYCIHEAGRSSVQTVTQISSHISQELSRNIQLPIPQNIKHYVVRFVAELFSASGIILGSTITYQQIINLLGTSDALDLVLHNMLLLTSAEPISATTLLGLTIFSQIALDFLNNITFFNRLEAVPELFIWLTYITIYGVCGFYVIGNLFSSTLSHSGHDDITSEISISREINTSVLKIFLAYFSLSLLMNGNSLVNRFDRLIRPISHDNAALEQITQNGFFNSRCPICLSDFGNGDAVTIFNPCKHALHTNCFEAWDNFQDDCPLCHAIVQDYEERSFTQDQN